MRVNPNQVTEGCMVSEDVFSLTQIPIVPKNTVLTSKNLEFIKAFLIQDIQIESTLVTGEPFKPSQVIQEEVVQKKVEAAQQGLVELYLKAVQGYKKLFLGWQSGIAVDMPSVRGIVVPVIEKALETPREIFSLHHYCIAEDYLYHHAITVAALSALLAKNLNFTKGDCIQIGLAGAMIDCGMAKIPPKIFNKKGYLTREEYDEVKKHPIYSYILLKDIKFLKEEVKKAVYQHHERIDGSGYPNGVNSDYIYPYERIISVADVYHAMTSERNYHSKQSPFKVLESILQDQFGKFDVRVVQALTTIMTNFSSGTKVRLSNSETGEIVFIEQKYPTRPMVRLDATGEIIQLIKHRDLYIEEIL
ncbi:MAG TPA: HD-GYP domain-containing protein [Bacillus bacterium]|nr:HD-GYP domain-containing protein [Bacillus sp. (in: firmicutes)]